MSTLEIVFVVARVGVQVIFLFFIGFGPGFVVGILLSNFIRGRGNPSYMELYEDNIREAGKFNSQWHPTHERWRKP